MPLEPRHGLIERLLLRKGHLPISLVATHREPVLDATVQIDLIVQAGLLQGFFGLVAEFGGEDGVGFYILSKLVRTVCRENVWIVREDWGLG